ncbi:hypothetical protein LCGC14_2434120, partial [marine sediment metagenome]
LTMFSECTVLPLAHLKGVLNFKLIQGVLENKFKMKLRLYPMNLGG